MTSRTRAVLHNALASGWLPPLETGAVLGFHRTMPGYRPSPLVRDQDLAATLGVASVAVKDESSRFGLPSFKFLGASWATFRLLCQRLGADPVEVGDLRGLRSRLRHEQVTLVAATDGNHGRAVARMARLLGIDAHILVPRDMAPTRVEALRSEGAAVTVVDGNYDVAVRRSAAIASHDFLVVSDTSWPGYEQVPTWVIEGYGTMAAEIAGQLDSAGAPRPTIVAAQVGVGAFASAMVRCFVPAGAAVIAVEPTRAACLQASIETGRPVSIDGRLDSSMAGLNCGTPSMIAWPVLRTGVASSVTIDDEDARAAMRLLARSGIVSGESGAAGLAGLMAFRDELGLGADDHVLVISTEGATDPDSYARTVSAG